VVRYVVVAREESVTPFHREIAALARDNCDYNDRYQDDSVAGSQSHFGK
jgi:hypothetical protein